MVRMRCVSVDNGVVSYEYMPEFKDAPSGVVSVEIATGERRVVSRSSEDLRGVYAMHALNRIEEMIEDNSFPEEAVSAWY